MRENWGMFVFGTYKQLPAGLMQAEQEITSAGQESHSKVCHPMDERSPAIQLRPSEKDDASKQALALWSTLGCCCCCCCRRHQWPGSLVDLSWAQGREKKIQWLWLLSTITVLSSQVTSVLIWHVRKGICLPLYRHLCLATTLIFFLA